MNEEEKKAVKYFYNLRATIDESNMLFDEEINVKHGKETIKQITIILNLIEKLQKENEMLKRCHIQDNKNLDFVMANCILKEKVKDKIEELSKTKGDLATHIAVSERIRALQEILEESEV